MRRTLVLGLDGATFRVLRPLIDDGHLPNITALVEDGASGTLASSMPPVTGPAWLSLATGLSPGSTGVYDFIRRVPESEGYDFEYIDATTYEGRAVWDHLGDAGVRAGVVDYPTLSPPYDVSGFMVSGGLGTAETETHPPHLAEDLAAFDVAGHIDIGAEEYADLSVFAEDIQANLAARLDRLEHVLETQEWEFCWAVLQESDWVQHLMWNCFDDDHPDAASVTADDRELFVDFWEQVDGAVGRCRDLVGDDGNLVLVSDHGFGPMEDRSFRLNTWLKRAGYLVPKSGGGSHFWLKKRLWNALSRIASAVALQERAPSLFRWGKNELSEMAIELNAMDLDRTTVFDPGHIQSMGGLYVNERVVDPEERTALRDEVREKLREFASRKGLPLDTFTPEELYGAKTPGSPDLLVRAAGINIENGGWDRPVVDRRPDRLSHQNGSHRRDGIVVAAGPDFRAAEIDGAHIWDVAPTLLHLFGQPVPSSMDGTVLTEALEGDSTVEYADVVRHESHSGSRRADEQEMEEQLRDLGYFE